MEASESQASDDKSIKTNNNNNNKKNKKKKKKKIIIIKNGYGSDTATSSSSFNNNKNKNKSGVHVRVGKRTRFILNNNQNNNNNSEFESIALPLGMSIAAFVAQVLERKESNGGAVAVDQLSKICTLAVRESLANVFGDKFDTFARNFEKSFKSTLMTLRLINETSQYSAEQDVHPNDEISQENAIPRISLYKDIGLTSRSEDHRGICEDSCSDRSVQSDLGNEQRSLHDGERDSQLACLSQCTTLLRGNVSTVNTFEKSVMEQTRANDLKTFEISLAMKKLQLKEKQLALNSDLNFLERWKLSMGISKASFKADKFKYEVEETRYAELLRKCIDCLVASLFVMLASIAYGTYVFAHNRIIEDTASCTPKEGSNSWWVPKPMASINSGMMILWCQVQVWSRIVFGLLMILSMSYLILQRSTASTQTMPVTFVLLLGVACGFAGKVCIDTLGGSGYLWLLYWELLCILHFLSNIFTSALFLVLYGPVIVTRVVKEKTKIPYWLRRVIFHTLLLVFLPLLCGLMPFATPLEWKDHFKLQVFDFLQASEV